MLLNPGQLPGAGAPSQRPGLTSFTTFRPPHSAGASQRTPRLLLSQPSSQTRSHPQIETPETGFAPLLHSLAGRIQESLRSNLQQLLQLNPSRREAICRHLEDCSGSPLPQSSGAKASEGSLERLRQWLDPVLLRAQGAQAKAVDQYLFEISVFTLAQALLLKAWSDRGNRKWKREDLQDLNSALHGALRSYVPMDREGWQITRPNLYSWFKLSAELQDALWRDFSGFRFADEGPDLMVDLLRSIQPAGRIQKGYDSGIFHALWRASLASSGDSEPARRKWAFCPTLRDGAVVRAGSSSFGWYGYDGDPISLYLSELGLLWWGPAAPPFWAMGSGLEALGRDQLSLNLASSAKPSLQQRISEMEACDVAWVSEEQVIRGTSRSVAASRYREVADQNPSLKRLRSGGTSLGHLQACVALTKLRPGGQLWWLRDEALHASDGAEALQYLLDRGRLVAEWDLSGLQLQFTAAGSRIPLPRHLSLWVRDTDLQRKQSHQPLLIQVKGQIRSHIELAPLFEEALEAARDPQSTDPAPIQRNGWQIRVRRSPQPQRDWANHWPESVREEDLQLLEALRQGSQPLAALAVIRPLEAGQAQQARTTLLLQGALRGFKVRQATVHNKRRLVCEPLQWGSDAEPGSFVVMMGDESVSAPIKAYLESEWAAFWLDHKAEIRGQRWILKDQDLRMIPIPSSILPRQSGFATPLPGSWERLSSELSLRPGALREALKDLAHDSEGTRVRAELFVRAARVLEDLRASHGRIAGKITTDGRIIWKGLLELCNPADLCPLTLHPGVRIQSGGFPLQTPILQVARAPRGQWSLRLTTEAGHSMQVEFENRGLYEILAEQIESLNHPTWSEIVEHVRAPRRLEELELRASEVLRTHGEQKQHIAQLESLVAETLPALLGR